MNTMVEKKSMASLANTSFIVLPPGFGRMVVWLNVSKCCSRTGQNAGGACEFRAPVSRVPSGEIERGVAGGEGDRQSRPERHAGQIDHQEIGHQHQQESQGPYRRDEVVCRQKA